MNTYLDRTHKPLIVIRFISGIYTYEEHDTQQKAQRAAKKWVAAARPGVFRAAEVVKKSFMNRYYHFDKWTGWNSMFQG